MTKKKKKLPQIPGRKVICRNKRAFHDYEILDQHEAGIVLSGSEVKSMRDGRASLNSDAYAEVRGGELFLVGAHIAEYPWANQFNHDPLRVRKLLMHKAEIEKLGQKLYERGFTLVPLEFFFLKGKVKVELGLAKGKHLYDKRESLKERDQARDLDQQLARRR